MSHRPLSLSDFKNWMNEQNGMSEFFNIESDTSEKYIGNKVRPKVSKQTLLEKIVTDDDEYQLIEEFSEYGGSVLGIEDKEVYVEVESGEFTIPRFCVKIKSTK